MKPPAFSRLSAASVLIGTLALAGCGAAPSFSNPPAAETPAPVAPQSVAGPDIKGSVYGGHAPIQGAHIYVFQPGTTGYGSAATSLIGNNGSTSSNGYVFSKNVSDPAPVGAEYVTTNANGEFSLAGSYTCVVGQPVYLYGFTGNFGGTTVKNNNIVQLLTVGVCPSSGNFTTPGNGAIAYVYMNEVSTVATAYTFQPYTLVTNNDAWHIGSSNTTQGLLGIVNAANTASQLYNIQGAQLSTSGDGEGHIANGLTAAGNGVVPQATLDTLANILADCVDSVPTVVGTPTSACNSLFTVATDNGEIGGTKPTDTATAAINIARFPAGNNSAATASVDATYVRDIFALQGSGTTPYVPQLSAQPHDWTIAISYPVSNASYRGVANNWAELAESLAVDANGEIWVTGQTNGSIIRLNSLGVIDPATAANYLNYIPGYVSVDGSGNAWTGNANCNASTPACPTGTALFEAGSNGVFTAKAGSGFENAYTVVTNQTGDIFFFAQTTATAPNYGMFEYGPGGTATIPGSPFNISGTATPATVNLNISAATVTHTGNGNNRVYTYTFTFTATNGPSTPLAVGDTVNLALTNDNGFFTPATGWQNLTSVTVATVNSTTKPTSFTATGTTPTTDDDFGNGATGTGTYSEPPTLTKAVPAGDNVAHGAIDAAGDLWITSESGLSIARVSPTGVAQFPSIITNQQPEFPAIDNSGNAWIPGYEAGSIYQVSPTGTLTTLTSSGTGAALVYPFGSAIDGNGNAWITIRCGPNNNCANPLANTSTLVEINGGVSTPGTANNAISPPTNYVPESEYPAAPTTFSTITPDPLNVAIDPSGNVWITNYTAVSANGSVTEIIGAAAPVVTPLSVAAGTNMLGKKP